jgi:site-specific DNA recombinase
VSKVATKSVVEYFADVMLKANVKKSDIHRIALKRRNILSIDIIRELKNKKVYIEFLDNSSLNTETADEMNLIFALGSAQSESREKSRRVRWGLKESAMKGVIFTNGKIYGYRYHSHNNSLEIVEDEAVVVRTVFELYNSGFGVRRIINVLNERGYKTREGKAFLPSMIKRMVQQEKYCGDSVRNKYDSGEVFNKHTYAKIKPKEEWIVHKDFVPAIIPRETFKKAQAIRDSKESSTGQRGVYKGIS